jgi:hypothetical protein
MKSFSEYLVEVEKESKGTFAGLKLSPQSSLKLYSALSDLEIENKLNAEQYHCTIICSKKYVPELEGIKPNLPISSQCLDWDMLGDCLVITLKGKHLYKLYEECINMGAVSDFEEYIPHITIAPHYEGELPTIPCPKIKLLFDEFAVDELNDEVYKNE